MKPYKHLDIIAVFFVVLLLLSNITAVKVISVGPLILPAAVILFPFVYILGDVLTEVYGYSRTRRVIWMGFWANILMAITFMIVSALPASPNWPFQEAFSRILGMTPRIVLASLVAYFCGEFLNSFVLAKLKIKTEGKHLWARTISSTLLAQAVDTVLFILIAFTGVLPNALLPTLLISQYLVKIAIEVVFTPVTYAVIGYLNRAEQEDHFDRYTNFNPFTSSLSS